MSTALAEREGLLRDVVENPDEDFPRLIFADWCEDNGEPERAEFIRAQVELARLVGEEASVPPDGQKFPDGWPEEARELCRTARRLFAPHLFMGRLNWRYVPRWGEVRRGFLTQVKTNLALWRFHGQRLVREHPLTRVELTDRTPDVMIGATGTRAAWRLGERSTEIPLFIYRHLASKPSGGLMETRVTYATRKEAQDALSAALLAWAKSEEP